jgi:hypothetical protein
MPNGSAPCTVKIQALNTALELWAAVQTKTRSRVVLVEEYSRFKKVLILKKRGNTSQISANG